MAELSNSLRPTTWSDGQEFKDDARRVGDAASKIKEHVSAAGHELVDALRGGVSPSNQTVNRVVDSVKEQGQVAMDKAAKQLKDHPKMTIAVTAAAALAAGLIIGALVLRSKR